MASNRYLYNNVLKTKPGKRYLSSTIYPKIKADDNDLYIITDISDRLDLLANKYYNNPAMWWILAVANNINDGTMYVDEGTQLRIPNNISKILSDFEKLNK